MRRLSAHRPQDASAHVESGILKGEDGWLFLWTGSNDVYRLYTQEDGFTQADTNAWVDLLNRRNDRFAQMGARYVHLTVPDKLSIYPERVPVGLRHFSRHPARQVARRFRDGDVNLDILPILRGRRGLSILRRTQQDLSDTYFFKTDSHWTFEGCRAAYDALCMSLGVRPKDFSDRYVGSREMALDLGSKLDPPRTEKARFARILRDSQRVHANEMVVYNEREGLASGAPRFVGCYVHNHNDHPNANPKTLVLFGDSFSEFRPHLLTAMLSETFRDVHFVWSTSLDFNFIESLSPDYVVTEIAERFMIKVPADDFCVDPS